MKRPDLTIRAVARMGKGSLLMIGDGAQRDEMQALGQRLLGERRFRLIPHLPHELLPQYYNACDVFTLASPEEIFGIVFLEAMACNKPVVAHDGPVQRWLIQEGGLLCDCLDPSGYAATLQQACESDWGYVPRQRAAGFSWELIAGKYDEAIQAVLAKRSQTEPRR